MMQSEMATGMELAAFAHDLRTPMSIAAGAAQLALEADGKDVSVQLRQIIQAVGVMDRMLSMMSNMPEAQRHILFTGRMLEDELLTMTQDRAKRKAQKLSVDLSALDGILLEADYAALCRLLVNLLSNAIKYTQEGGEISVRAQNEFGQRKGRDGYIKFIVADNGTGMTPAFMRRMYLPYARARETEEIEGHGLGLSIVREMVQRMGGRIRVRSIRGKGTMFVASVPVKMRNGA